MRATATILSALLVLEPAAPARAGTPAPSPETPVEVEIGTITVTAPRVVPHAKALERTRTVGTAAAVGGGALMASAVFLGFGPFGWAAALLFLGGGSAYLSNRRLHGEDDFGPGARRAAAR